MKNKKLQIILQIVKILSFILFIYSLIKLIPTMFNTGIFGILFLIVSSIYILNELFIFLIKDEKINSNNLINMLNIIISIYIILIASRYTNTLNSAIYELDDMYFKINYIVAMIGMIGVIFNNLTLLIDEK